MSEPTKKGLVPVLRFPEFRDQGEWKEIKLGQLGNLVQGLTYSPDDIRENGLLVLRSSNVQNGEIRLEDNVYVTPNVKGANLSKPNDILICVRNGSKALIGKNALIPEGMPLSTHGAFMTVFRSPSAEFVFQLFQTSAYQSQVDGDLGATINSINGSNFVKYKFYVPKSAEQQKIADCLSSVDELVTAQTQKVEALKAHKKGLMQQLFPAEGETVPKLRFPEFRDAREWEPKPLGKVAEIITGNTPSTFDSDNYGGKKLFVSPADISDGRYITHTKTTLSEQGFSKTRYIPEDSVLFVCIGSTIGKVAQNKFECATNQQINALVPLKNYSSGFIYFSLDNDASKIASLAGRQAVPIINKSLFSSVLVSFPSTDEQQKIAACLTSIDDLITTQTQKLSALKDHKKGLMQQLFPSSDEAEA
ncbi:restriction endonuclease subunit S [Methylicorpusculum oleiharenae]|jgi:type I restriction enzyme, S subunit|uniref:restriction endonuclease subunit S n=1 Tax=Methylicorpusculum oleiharenae TaxID=1338687 RepID=UPI00135B6124|nr:restriction endonuclease subunit S [Methylicorpusculum oleiharenae]MCD2453409.1 restriction endonuclease subunit S [Methylicorpusculum oleiharenae]